MRCNLSDLAHHNRMLEFFLFISSSASQEMNVIAFDGQLSLCLSLHNWPVRICVFPSLSLDVIRYNFIIFRVVYPTFIGVVEKTSPKEKVIS